MRELRLWFAFVLAVLITWTLLVWDVNIAELMSVWWPATVTMIGGSFIAGASAEGGGAVAYPVFTLLLNIPPDSARNFSFIIQSVGMVSASLLIIGKRIVIEPRAILHASVGGIVGMLAGTFVLVPFLDPTVTKLFFVSLWMAFGIGLWRINRKSHRVVLDVLPPILARNDIGILVMTGFLGGTVTAVFGNGIDIATFCVLTLWYGMSEKVATPTSVVLMSVFTLFGAFLHCLVIGDIGPVESSAWLAAAPVVLFFAPLGAWLISKLHRLHIARLLQVIVLVQFIGALYVLKPTAEHLALCGVVVLVGTALMFRIDRSKK